MSTDPTDNKDLPRGLQRIYENVTQYQEGGSDIETEIAQLKGMLDKNPESNDIQEWLAFKLYSAARYSEAEVYFRALISNNHRPGFQYFYLGNLLAKTGRQQEAVESWKQTISLIPDDVKAKKARARIKKITGSAPP